METLSLMLIDSSEEFRKAVDRELSDSYSVYHYANGKDALNAVVNQHPDIIVLDLMLPELDGVSLLHEIRSNGLRPMVLIVTRLLTDYVMETAAEMGIGYIIRKPCSSATVAARIRDLTQRMKPKNELLSNPKHYLAEIMKSLHFSPRHRGFDYLLECAMIMCKKPNSSVTKDLYPTIAINFGCTVSQVERAIRIAINAAWSQEQAFGWDLLFPPDAGGRVPRPSNGVMIARLAELLRSRQPKG